jgi:hypothetical protein
MSERARCKCGHDAYIHLMSGKCTACDCNGYRCTPPPASGPAVDVAVENLDAIMRDTPPAWLAPAVEPARPLAENWRGELPHCLAAAPPEGGRGEPDFVDTPTGKALWKEKLRQQTEATITLPREEWEAHQDAVALLTWAIEWMRGHGFIGGDTEEGAFLLRLKVDGERALAALERRKP